MYDCLLKLFLGIIILLIFTKTLVELAKKISATLRISPLIIGITIVALSTSLPELAVSLIAAVKQDVGLAIGNIVGSNIANILMVFPAAILIGKLRIGTTKTQRSAFLLLGITALFMILHFMSIPSFFLGMFFIALAILITVIEYKWGEFGSHHEDLFKLRALKREKFTFAQMVGLLCSIAGIIIGGIFVVGAVEKIALISGYSTTILGLSITAIATSLPELLTTIFSQGENQEKITIGNIIGSNIYNLLFIGGIITLFSAKSVPPRDWLVLGFATLCFVLILKSYSGQKIPRWVGGLLLFFFAIYLYLLGSSRFNF